MGVSNALYQPYKALEKITVIAAGPISANRCVDHLGNQAGTAGMAIYGVADMPALAIGDRIPAVTLGEAVIEAGAAIATAGARLSTDAQGRIVTSAAGNEIFGRALTTATAAGEFVLVNITKEGVL